MTDDEIDVDLTEIEFELDLTALGAGLIGALVATASTLLPNLAYLGQTGVLLAQNQLPLQLGGVALLLGAALIQARRTHGGWGLHGTVLRQGGATFLAAFLLISFVAVPVLASSGSDGDTRQLEGENLKVAYLEVDGMVCQGCQASINGFLRNQPGVRSTGIRLAKSGGPVVFDPSKTSAEELANGQIFQGYYSATVKRVEQYQQGS